MTGFDRVPLARTQATFRSDPKSTTLSARYAASDARQGGLKYLARTATARFERRELARENPSDARMVGGFARTNASPLSSRASAFSREGGSVDFARSWIGSTCVESYAYFPKARDMDIRFVNGKKTYTYHNVDDDVWRAWNEASSKGHFLNAVLKPNTWKLGAQPHGKVVSPSETQAEADVSIEAANPQYESEALQGFQRVAQAAQDEDAASGRRGKGERLAALERALGDLSSAFGNFGNLGGNPTAYLQNTMVNDGESSIQEMMRQIYGRALI